MASYDLMIRGATIVDGTGGAPFEGDVAIKGGRIAEVGKVSGSGAEEIAAKGMVVTPGFIDFHTHYDAQATWSDRFSPSTNHGVTTVVLGNCGVGFAPCRADHRDMLVRVMEGVEDIPGIVMKEGIPWTWETFPDYLDTLAARRYDADIVTQIPHSAVRVYVMGERGANHEPPTDDDLAAMTRTVRDAVRAGAFGFSTTRHPHHRLKDGTPAPSVKSGFEEMRALALGLKEAGSGIMQIAEGFTDLDHGLPMWRAVAEAVRHPMTLSITQSSTSKGTEEWRRVLGFVEQAQKDGLQVKGQVCVRPIGILMGHGASSHPFIDCPSYQKLKDLRLPERIAALRDPALRARLIVEKPQDPNAWRVNRIIDFDGMYRLGDPPNYSPAPDSSIGAEAKRRGLSPQEVAYDALMERDGRALIYYPTSNFRDRNLDAVHEMINHPHTYLGIADGGAHVNYICDAGAPTFVLSHWTRDTTANPRVPLEKAVNWLSRKPAQFLGLNDRGVIAPGYKADLNVIDYDRLTLRAPQTVYDLPTGASRFVQDAEGYVATVQSGAVTYRGGKPTDALPGRLVRGPQALRH